MQAWSRGECGCGMRGSTEGGVETVCVQMCKAPLAHLSVSRLTQMCQGTEPVSVDATHRHPPVSLLFLPVPSLFPSLGQKFLAELPVGLFSGSLPCPSLNGLCYTDGYLPSSWAAVLMTPSSPRMTRQSDLRLRRRENPLLSSPTLWLYRVFTSIELPLITTLRMIWLYYYYLHTE